jgi:hypothetical protein
MATAHGSLRNPESVEIELLDGSKKAFILSDFPAVAGREILTQYPVTGMPKLGEYKSNEQIMFKLMSFVGVEVEGRVEPLRLTTAALIDNHIPDPETLMRVEYAMLQRNCSFFRNGKGSDFFGRLLKDAVGKLMSTLTASLPASSVKGSQHSTN